MNIFKEQIFQVRKTIRLRNQIVDFSQPLVMGILNVTPDSFYDGGKYSDEKSILTRTQHMLEQGANIIDIGGYSSRPKAEEISLAVELARVIPAINLIIKEFPNTFISIDTFRAEVAKAAVDSGACLINDISGGELDPAMFDALATLKVPYVLMHMRGDPQTMQSLTDYDNILLDILSYFEKKVYKLRELGQADLILDPGFGFAKSIDQNFYLLNHLEYFRLLNIPLMVGISRKSMVYKTLEIQKEEALNGTTVLNTIALLRHASILRVHDVKEAVEAIRLANSLAVEIT
ncbi:MAG: dihydropteroate synthase [Microscillaceae bacterium]|nr:dihydropteroate synthase [Microscillaceae bacterium]